MGEGLSRERPPLSVALVPRESIATIWPVVCDWIEAALAHSFQHELSIADVHARLMSMQYLLLVAASDSGRIFGCTVVAKGATQERVPYLAIIGVGGRHLDQWMLQSFAAVRAIAVAEGCERIIGVGRPGWARELRRHGIRTRALVMHYDLTAADRACGMALTPMEVDDGRG